MHVPRKLLSGFLRGVQEKSTEGVRVLVVMPSLVLDLVLIGYQQQSATLDPSRGHELRGAVICEQTQQQLVICNKCKRSP